MEALRPQDVREFRDLLLGLYKVAALLMERRNAPLDEQDREELEHLRLALTGGLKSLKRSTDQMNQSPTRDSATQVMVEEISIRLDRFEASLSSAL